MTMVRDGDSRPLHTIRQSCDRCGAQRNPISLVMTRSGKGMHCKDSPDVVDRDWSVQLARVKQQLEWTQQDGGRVNLLHTGREFR